MKLGPIMKGYTRSVLVAVSILLLLGLAVFVTYRVAAPREAGPAGGGILLQIDDSAVPYAKAPPADRSGGTGIKIPGYGSITLPAGETDVRVALLNPEDNPCYFTFELVLDDSGESLYRSGMVEPAMCIEEISLTQPLAAGEYGATVKIRTYSLEGAVAMNNANVKTVLKVV